MCWHAIRSVLLTLLPFVLADMFVMSYVLARRRETRSFSSAGKRCTAATTTIQSIGRSVGLAYLRQDQ